MADVSITLPPINVGRLSVVIVGDSPLITHAWSQKAREMMLAKQMKKATAAKQAKNPWEDFCDSLYWISPRPDGDVTEADIEKATFGIPSIGLKNSFVTACTSIGGITKVAARQAFHVEGQWVEILGSKPSMREDVVRVGMGTADLRYRGEFSPWHAVVPIRYNAAMLSPEQIVNLVNVAGFGVGIFEWRPERDGSYGMFHVASDDEGKALTKKAKS